MRLVRDADALSRWRAGRPVALTIGAFDGIHLGHQALLASVMETAEAQALVPMVMTFEPTPKEYFASSPPARLTRFRERFELMREAGLAACFCPRFGREMAEISPQRFISELLVDAAGIRHLVIGDDFRFGYRAEGGVGDLLEAATRFDFGVEQVGSVFVGADRVSSTRIRAALANGDLAQAERCLGRPFTLSGKVIRGQQLGRTLGYPTANIALHRQTSPVSGIYAVRIAGIGNERRDGVASIGTRPTVDGQGVLLEVYVFDYAGDLYGRRLEVTLVAHLRDEERFDSLDALTVQMRRDEDNARAALAATLQP